jgi:hypothetical protein
MCNTHHWGVERWYLAANPFQIRFPNLRASPSLIPTDAPSGGDASAINVPHLAEWFRRLSRPSFFIRADTLEIVDMNPSACEMFKSAGEVSSIAGRLLLGGKQPTERFRAFLAELGEGPSAYAVNGGGDQDHLVLRVEKIPDARLVAVQAFPTAGKDALWADTGAIFGLTRAEDR